MPLSFGVYLFVSLSLSVKFQSICPRLVFLSLRTFVKTQKQHFPLLLPHTPRTLFTMKHGRSYNSMSRKKKITSKSYIKLPRCYLEQCVLFGLCHTRANNMHKLLQPTRFNIFSQEFNFALICKNDNRMTAEHCYYCCCCQLPLSVIRIGIISCCFLLSISCQCIVFVQFFFVFTLFFSVLISLSAPVCYLGLAA